MPTVWSSTIPATTRTAPRSSGPVRTDWHRPKAPGGSERAAPTWASWRDGVAVVAYRPHLVKTVRIALLVGTLLFAINQLDVVVGHHATAITFVKVALTYLVPFGV